MATGLKSPLKQDVRLDPSMAGPWPADFPVELAYHVFKYLPQADLARACLVSRHCIGSPSGQAYGQGITLLRPVRYGRTLTYQTYVESTRLFFRTPSSPDSL